MGADILVTINAALEVSFGWVSTGGNCDGAVAAFFVCYLNMKTKYA